MLSWTLFLLTIGLILAGWVWYVYTVDPPANQGEQAGGTWVMMDEPPPERREVAPLGGPFRRLLRRFRDIGPPESTGAGGTVDGRGAEGPPEASPTASPPPTLRSAAMALDAALGKISTIDVFDTVDIVRRNGPHLALLGASQSGKSSLVKALLLLLGDPFCIIDPNAKQGGWTEDGAGVWTTGEGDDYQPIELAFNTVMNEMRARVELAKRGASRRLPLTVVCDEINDIMEELPETKVDLRRLAKRSAGYGMRLVICPHSDNVEELGLSLNTRKNFAWIYLGEHARNVALKLRKAGQMGDEQYAGVAFARYPCILYAGGTHYIVDTQDFLPILELGLPSGMVWEFQDPAAEETSEVDPVFGVLARLVEAGALGEVKAIEIGLGLPSGSSKAYVQAKARLSEAIRLLREDDQ